MFTGIIEALGSVTALNQQGEDIRLEVKVGSLDMSDVKVGDSIAVNGVCLTAVEFSDTHFVADVSNETIRHSSFQFLKVNSTVNLEKALTPTSRLGGHLVSGHVDGLATIVDRYEDGRAIRFVIEPPAELNKYIAAKGSICIDGISLTVNDVEANRFYLNIVPHTADVTTAGHWHKGTQINLEVDVIARYLERMLSADKGDEKSSAIDKSFLAENGFLK